jgi:rhodanese-related sulfurtransferase
VIKLQIEFNNIYDKSRIIDIRSSLDYSDKHIPNSINIPRMILMTNPDLYMNKNEEYYLICDSGKISLSCAKILNALGYRCFSINGGIDNILK